jgi:hypothetical protein
MDSELTSLIACFFMQSGYSEMLTPHLEEQLESPKEFSSLTPRYGRPLEPQNLRPFDFLLLLLKRF